MEPSIIDLISTLPIAKPILYLGSNGYLPGSSSTGISPQSSTTTAANAYSATRHSLSKELMQKLRSMTETIKMLSDENEVLRRENDRIRDEEEGVYTVVKHEVGTVGASSSQAKVKSLTSTTLAQQKSHKIGENYEDMNKSQLIALTVSYDQKVKTLSEEIHDLQREIIHHNNVGGGDTAKNENATGGDTGMKNDTGASKDKYKTLARRLKEERNQYRDTCEEKQ